MHFGCKQLDHKEIDLRGLCLRLKSVPYLKSVSEWVGCILSNIIKENVKLKVVV